MSITKELFPRYSKRVSTHDMELALSKAITELLAREGEPYEATIEHIDFEPSSMAYLHDGFEIKVKVTGPSNLFKKAEKEEQLIRSTDT
jgi:hypothetical protein